MSDGTIERSHTVTAKLVKSSNARTLLDLIQRSSYFVHHLTLLHMCFASADTQSWLITNT